MHPLRASLARARPVAVQVPGLDEPCYVRALSVAALSRFLAEKESADGPSSLALLVALSVCDSAGDLLFAGDEASARDLPLDLVKALADATMAANGLTMTEGGPKNL
jgi:hypothetical protein